MRFYVKPRRKPTVIIVTMIDIFSVLLIFFIVATTFRKSLPAVKISLPEAKAGSQVSQSEPIMVTVTPDDKVFVGGKEIEDGQLDAAFQSLGKQTPLPSIAMQADKKAPFGLIIKVMDAAKAAGFSQLPAFIEQERKP